MLPLKSIDIVCPICGNMAQFNEPFLFLNRKPDITELRPYHQWGGWFVVEKYPSLLNWQAPRKDSLQRLLPGSSDGPGYALMTKGVIGCCHCHASCVYLLNWPEDAWWQWQIRGKVLYARDRLHALAILNFVRARHRPPRPLVSQLGRIPSYFLTAKVRDEVMAKIEKTLQYNT